MTTSWWHEEAEGTPFGIESLPYGVFRAGMEGPRVGVRIGERVLDLAPLAGEQAPALVRILQAPTLNPLMAAGPAVWAEVRARVVDWLSSWSRGVEQHLHRVDEVTLELPFQPADYVDFYSSRHHAENLGTLFRPGQPPLTPNWLHLPIGYHGRSGSLVVSGTDVVRPRGQIRVPGSDGPVVSVSRKLDIEAEVGFVVGVPSRLGRPVPASSVREHVFGVVLVNDWSARDLQAWEYVPLGPFLGKSFATSVSAWVLPLAALDDAHVAPPPREVELVDYLRDGEEPWGLDIDLTVRLNGTEVSRPPFEQMYWTIAQQLAHLTVNGAALRTGDLLASGTVSGPRRDQRGSLIELSWNGAEPVELGGGRSRTFLEDGDEVVIAATAPGPGGTRIGLGEVAGRIVGAE
jgi:fumarylacetoacetase